MEKYMKTTGKSYRSRIYKCSRCGEVFESDVSHGSYEVVTCPKCMSMDVSERQKTLSSLKEEKKFGVKYE